MRLRSSVRVPAIAIAAWLVVGVSYGAHALQQPSVPTSGSPSDADVARALDIVKADPNFATDRTIRMLRWKQSTQPKTSGLPDWLTWIAGLFRWIEQSARILVWVAAVILAGLLAVYLAGALGARQPAWSEPPLIAPTHVRDLDIRPESLPADIGAAARMVWERGAHRASLALLYRGMLSRLAHVHRLPIRDSTTEGDCLALAASHLTLPRREYTSSLVSVWQAFVYGGQKADAATVYVLCDGFASALDSITSADSTGAVDSV
ncbi:MAG TPA: DUF4129 domain-containing protein [Vicinamibacterales bacterium]|nr:DUF4129 domain-containing protein [Vicinamibacterales bacterium]